MALINIPTYSQLVTLPGLPLPLERWKIKGELMLVLRI